MVNSVLSTGDRPELLESKYLACIILLALAINLVVWYLSRSSVDVHFQLAPFMQIDSIEYINLGKHIFENWDFPNFSRTPIYPFFVGFFQQLLGLNINQFILVQIGLSLVNIWLIWRLSAYFLAPKYQLLATLIFALDPVTIQVSNYVLSETLFSFLLLAGINILLYMKSNVSKYWFAALAGLIFGLFALCRPIGQFLPILLLLWFFISTHNQSKKRLLLITLLATLMFMSIPEAWKQRNQYLTGHSFISTTTSINMYNYRAAWNVARRDGRNFDDVKHEFQEIRNEYVRNNPHLSKYEVAEHFTKQGLAIIFDTPWETIQQGVRGLVYLYGGIYNASINKIFGDGISAWIVKLYSIVYILLVYLGILFSMLFYKRLSSEQKSCIILCAIVVAYFTFFSSAVEAYARLRAPFFPYIVIVSVIGWLNLSKTSSYKIK